MQVPNIETAAFLAVDCLFALHAAQMEVSNATSSIMNASDISDHVITLAHAASEQFHKIPGSAIFLRYVKSSYQNDPVRSAVELFLVLFAIRYLLAPKYSTKPNYVKLSEEVRNAPAENRILNGD